MATAAACAAEVLLRGHSGTINGTARLVIVQYRSREYLGTVVRGTLVYDGKGRRIEPSPTSRTEQNDR